MMLHGCVIKMDYCPNILYNILFYFLQSTEKHVNLRGIDFA